MRDGRRIGVVIPALNEEAAIGRVLAAIPSFVDRVIVADNNSTDGTSAVAKAAGAEVVTEVERGYGAACLRALAEMSDVDIVVFLDGDFSDYPEEMPLLVDPILREEADLMIGSRLLTAEAARVLTPPQRFGNWLACRLLRLIWGASATDLGPFRAIDRTALQRIGMRDRNYGWTVEMQIRAALQGLRVGEVPVRYRPRIGTSKVSGTVKGVCLAGATILWTIARFAWLTRVRRPAPSHRNV